MPYGADAIAYAASTSRHEVDVPPPDFDVSDSEIPPVPGSSQAGPSRLRAISNAEDFVQEQEQEETVPHQSTDSSVPNDGQPVHPSETPVDHVAKTDDAPTSDPASDKIRDTDSSLPPTASAGIPPYDALPVDLGTAAPPSSYKASDVEESKASSIHLNAAVGLGLGAPSSKSPSIYDRSASRASSVQTFATAAESMHTASSQIDLDPVIGHLDTSNPTTPKVPARSVLPSTDAAVVQTGTVSTSDEAAHAV